ncbi:hypothetical protein PHLGIDRAFT_100651 [Phlebiopsis gigantea 11061_1 CR5-6]|uniref:Zn(2)-C6 fungal-type domain-containing protein n=1 Tax=Phlebiopsis gigantea (strain 11061_1 CR5-6) TaxID=745531 RepID=A0A0C3NZF6_PHLG1|nr:hypothetical protein PHLGIDRAFT_100651 [Phlebiopsis gigantea 11061_1 CR5-6]
MSSYLNDPAHADASESGPTTSHHHDGTDRADSNEHDDEGGKKKKTGKRRKVNHACLYCRRSHMTCDEGRPCQRCIKREIGHLCHDERRMTPKDKTPTVQQSPAPAPVPNPPIDVARVHPVAQYGAPPPPLPGLNPAWPSMNLTPQNAFLYQPETLGNEFSVLSDFLESLDEGSFFDQPTAGAGLMDTSPYTNPLALAMDNASSYLSNTQPATEPALPEPEKPPEEPVPVVLPAATKTERFFLTAADQASGTRNERLNMVIRSKYEAGLLKPYNYVKGYARLSRWMDKNVSPESKQKILQPLSILRPKFRAIAQSESLTDIDLVFIEEAFERLLLDYDRVFSAMAIPACLWRRTGEIYKANREFAELVGVDGYMLRDGRLCIYELMAEDSAVNYWEKYGAVAFDTNQKAVLTTCQLRYKPALPSSGAAAPGNALNGKFPNASEDQVEKEQGTIDCCFSFTIRRDPYGIPTLIVGNFIKC